MCNNIGLKMVPFFENENPYDLVAFGTEKIYLAKIA